MQATNEIAKLHRQGRALRTATLYGATVIAFATAALWFGFDTGEHHQAKADMQELAAIVYRADYPTVYLTYPGLKAAAIVRNGVCYPYPAHVPPFHYYHYVSPQWEPCTQLPGIKKVAPSPALAAIEEHVQ